MKTKLDIIIIGAGAQGRKYIEALSGLPSARIKAVCVKTGERAREIRKGYKIRTSVDYKKMLGREKADLVIISTDVLSQFAIAEHVLIHTDAAVLIEKPVSYSVESLFRLFKLAEKRGRNLFWNNQEKFSGFAYGNRFSKVKEIIIHKDYILRERNLSVHIENLQSILEHVFSYFEFDFAKLKIISKRFIPFEHFYLKLRQGGRNFEISLVPGDEDRLRLSAGGKTQEVLDEGDAFKNFLARVLEAAGAGDRSFSKRRRKAYLEQAGLLEEIFFDLEEATIIRPNFECNERCLFCNSPEGGRVRPEVLIGEVGKAARESINHIVFSGGEPTLYPGIFRLIEAAREHKIAEIEIATNAVACAEEAFSRRLAAAGLTSAFVSLHAPDARLSERLTGLPGSFSKTLAGLRNLKRYGIRITPNIVINKLNFKLLKRYVRFLLEEVAPFDYISFSVAMPGMNALKNGMVPRYSEIKPYLLEAFDLCRQEGVPFVNPFCGAPVCFTPGFEDFSLEYKTLKNLSPTLKKELEKNQEEKTKVEACKTCLFREYCMGIWKGYLALYPEERIEPVIKNRDYVSDYLINHERRKSHK